jgi:N-acetylglucosaminyl-diphospho-decaprenol L-rhamnosyltransferase
MSKLLNISIYILNYNGQELLLECLPSIIAASKLSKHNAIVHVIDNLSPDKSLEVIESHFPCVQVHKAIANDFLCSFNNYVKNDSSEIVVLMNNDIKVEEDFLDPLVKVLEQNNDAFFSSSYCLTFDKKNYEGGVSTLVHKYGWWGTLSEDSPKLRQPNKQLYTISIGACLAIKTEVFNELGGYDRIYLPGTLEDLDLCYRGWKKGWKGYYVPESVIYHKGQASFRPKFGKDKIRKLATRNTIFFIWKNIDDRILLVQHTLCLPLRLIVALLKLDFAFISGVFSAIISLQTILKIRSTTKSQNKISDRFLITLFKQQKRYLKGD